MKNWLCTTHLLLLGPLCLGPTLAQGGGCPGTFRVSVDSAGGQSNYYSLSTAISGDGRHIAFGSFATNLVPGDTNLWDDVFVHDTLTGSTSRVSVGTGGIQGNSRSMSPSISADGRQVGFSSLSTNLVPGDLNMGSDAFVHDTLTGSTIRVSVNTNGVEGNSSSGPPLMSRDGRFATYMSQATNLVAGDTNGARDAFLHDMTTGVTTLVSVDSNGIQGNDDSIPRGISGNGRFVCFTSSSTNLVPGDSNNLPDCFVRDTWTGTTTRVSLASNGAESNGLSARPSISADGRFVAFYSMATNLVPGDTNEIGDIFLHDSQSGITTKVSVNSSGEPADAFSYIPSLSADGRFVAFESAATNLVPGDTNSGADVFLHDTLTGTTQRASVSSSGVQGDYYSNMASISDDGSLVAFASICTNLVTGDTNAAGDIFVACVPSPAPCTLTFCTVADGNLENHAQLSASGCGMTAPLTLDLSNGPAGQVTYLVVGSGTGIISNPGGAAGKLCLAGGFLGRYTKDLGPISTSGTFSVDISNSISGGPSFGIPDSGGAAFQPGETWYFQYWHRRPAGQSSAFSEAVGITFQ